MLGCKIRGLAVSASKASLGWGGTITRAALGTLAIACRKRKQHYCAAAQRGGKPPHNGDHPLQPDPRDNAATAPLEAL